MARSDDHAPALACSGVIKQFGALRAVDGIDLEVPRGEIFALLGPNGAGKTTLIHCIAGLARATAGQIRVFGHDVVADFRTTRRLVGLVPQEVNFDPFFTPVQSLMIQMGLMGVPPSRGRAEALLETFALTSHRHAYSRHLSGGMKRRLLVAKALVHEPQLLFLDEPTAGVDVELRKELWAEVRALREKGTTIILTTHYLEEAEELADRVGVIHRGRLLLVEERDALMRRYRRASMTLELEEPVAEIPAGMPEGTERLGPKTLRVPWTDPAQLETALTCMRAHGRIRDVSMQQTTLEDIFVDLIASADGRARNGRAGAGEPTP